MLESEYVDLRKLHPDYVRRWEDFLDRWAGKKGLPEEYRRWGLWRWRALPPKMRELCRSSGIPVNEDYTLKTAQLQVPHLVVASPRDEQELRSLVLTALAQDHPFALHYPRDAGFGVPEETPRALPIGQGEVVREGEDILIVGFGPIVRRGLEVADTLASEGWSAGVINARFAKPLDRQLIVEHARGKRLVVTLEESVVVGGFGAAVLEAIEEARLVDPAFRDVVVRSSGSRPIGSSTTGR